MNFVQQFTEQQLTGSLSSHLTQQLQTCHSAVEDLICHLEALRATPKNQQIQRQITRLEGYLTTKQQLITLLQDNSPNAISEWVTKAHSKCSLLGELLRREEGEVGFMMQKIVKRVFLPEESLKEFIEESQMAGKCLLVLKDIQEELGLKKTPSREKVRNADELWTHLEVKIQTFGTKIDHFNREMAVVTREFEEFEENIRQQFKQFLINR